MAAGDTARAARSVDIQDRLAGVSITEGSTQLARMCWGRSSWASNSVIRTTAALLVPCATGAAPPTAVFDPTVTMAPPPARRMREAASWAHHSSEVTLDSHISDQTSSVRSASELGLKPPARLTSAVGN